jgi:hypothetical protein
LPCRNQFDLGIKHEWEQSARIVPIHFWITRRISLVPDYGYYSWLFDPAFQPLFPAFNLPIWLVTAKLSDCPFDCFFRIDLRGRSLSSAIIIRPCDQSDDERFHLSEDKIPLWLILRNRGSFKFINLLNQPFNEPLTAIFVSMNIESKLSAPTSTLPECESWDPEDRFLNPIKNLIPSPFVQSSLLSLVWWNKDTAQEVFNSNILKGLNKLNIIWSFQQLFKLFWDLFYWTDPGIPRYKHIISRVINNFANDKND